MYTRSMLHRGSRRAVAALVVAAAALFAVLPTGPAYGSTDGTTPATVDCSRGVNLSFEEPAISRNWRPVNQASVPGWSVDGTAGVIEIWVDGFLGVPATDGRQLSELQARGPTSTYQDVPTAAGDVIAWSVDHRGRARTETAEVRIGSPGAVTTVERMTTPRGVWRTYSGEYVVPAGQTTTRFMLTPIGTGSVGNLVDDVVLALTCGIDAATTASSVADVDDDGRHSAGDVATVTTTVTNVGTATVVGLDVSAPAARTAVCDTDALTPGETGTCTSTYTLSQADVDGGSVAGTVTVSGRDAAGVAISAVASFDVALDAVAGLDATLDVTVDAATTAPTGLPNAGDTVTVALTVTNVGNVTVSGVAATEQAMGAMACTDTDLAPGASATCTVDSTLTQVDVDAGVLAVDVSYGGTAADGTDLSDDRSGTVDLEQSATMVVTQTVDPTGYDEPGDVVAVTIVVENTGTVTLSDVSVAHGLAAPDAADCGVSPFTLAPGETRTCTVERVATQADVDAGALAGAAAATALDPEGGPVEASSDPVTVTADRRPSLTVAASSDLDTAVVAPSGRPDAGDRVTTGYTVTNTGNVTLDEVEVTLPDGTPVPCPDTGLAPGETTVCVRAVDLTQADVDAATLDLSATAGATAPDGSPVGATVDHTVEIDRAPDVDLVTVVEEVTSNGDGTYTVLYSVTVTNTGNTTTSDLDVDSGLGSAFPQATVASLHADGSGSNPFASVTPLQPGDSVTVRYVVEAAPGGTAGPFTTTSEVTATGPGGEVTAAATAAVEFDVRYDLALDVGAPPSVAPGGTYTQRFRITNAGPAAAFGPIVLSVELDRGVSLRSSTGEGWACTGGTTVLTCTFDGRIDAGASTDLTVVTRIDADYGATLRFETTVSGVDDNDVEPTNNVLAATVTVDQLPVTGIDSDQMTLIGLVLLLAGMALVAGTRRRGEAG